MGRTGGFWEQDLAFPDGQIFLSGNQAMSTAASAVVQNGTGQYGQSFSTAGTAFIGFSLNSFLFRYGKQDDAQQQFGMSNPVGGFQGAQSQPTPPAAFTTPWGPGRSPQKSTLFGKPILSRPKGIAIQSVSVAYRVPAAALTSATIGITGTSWVNGVNPFINQILAPTAIPVGVSTFPQVASVTIPLADQIMLTDYNTQYIAEIAANIPAGGVFYLVGLFLNVAYNFN